MISAGQDMKVTGRTGVGTIPVPELKTPHSPKKIEPEAKPEMSSSDLKLAHKLLAALSATCSQEPIVARMTKSCEFIFKELGETKRKMEPFDETPIMLGLSLRICGHCGFSPEPDDGPVARPTISPGMKTAWSFPE